MSRVVRPSDQVIDFVRKLAPEPRRVIKRALQDLRDEKGDIRALEAALPHGAEALGRDAINLRLDVRETERFTFLKCPTFRQK